jgi:anti-sigma factor (TIGR02949 family)
MNCTDVIQYLGPYLDSELDVSTTAQVQAHLSRCPRCCERFDQEQALEDRIAESLKSSATPDDGRRWERILRRAVPRPEVSARRWGVAMVRAGSHGANWIALVASLVILAALASAGLGLRHSGRIIIPGASWMLQRFALGADRHPDDLVRLPGEPGSHDGGIFRPRMPDA